MLLLNFYFCNINQFLIWCNVTVEKIIEDTILFKEKERNDYLFISPCGMYNYNATF